MPQIDSINPVENVSGDGGERLKSSHNHKHFYLPDKIHDAPPMPPAQTADDHVKFGGREKKVQGLEVISRDEAPIPLVFQHDCDSKSTKKASVHVSSQSADHYFNANKNLSDTSSPPSHQSRHTHNHHSTKCANDSAHSEYGLSFNSQTPSPGNNNGNDYPPFYEVEASLVEPVPRTQYPHPSAPPPQQNPVIDAVLINGHSNDPKPPISPPPVPCWKRHQTALLIGAIIVIVALTGSVIAVVLVGKNNGSNADEDTAVTTSTVPTTGLRATTSTRPTQTEVISTNNNDQNENLFNGVENKIYENKPDVKHPTTPTTPDIPPTTPNPSYRDTTDVGGSSKLLCAVNNDCKSNFCALESFDPDASMVCCESGSTKVWTYGLEGWPMTFAQSEHFFCINQPVGTQCGATDKICASGACVLGKCADSKTAVTGECSIDNDCQNDFCGFGSFNPDEPMVCCESGSIKVWTYGLEGWPATFNRLEHFFCIKQSIDTQCGATDEICASGACVLGKCADSKTVVGGKCNIDNDCQSNFYGFGSFNPDGPMVCCESGSIKVWTYGLDGWPMTFAQLEHSFCIDQPIGTQCGATDEICASGACVLGECADSKI